MRIGDKSNKFATWGCNWYQSKKHHWLNFHELVDPVFNWDLKTEITNANLLSMIQSLELIVHTWITNDWANGGVGTRTAEDTSGGNGHCKDLMVLWAIHIILIHYWYLFILITLEISFCQEFDIILHQIHQI